MHTCCVCLQAFCQCVRPALHVLSLVGTPLLRFHHNLFLQDLSMLCMSRDPDERPSFAQIVTRLEELNDLTATDPLEMMSEGYPMHIL